MEDALKSVKEFIWDVVGYLIPGFLLIIVLNLILLPKIAVDDKFLFDWKVIQNYMVVVVSYVLGYVIYSLTIFKIKTQDFVIDMIRNFSSYINNTRFNYLTSNRLSKYFVDKIIIGKHSETWKDKAINSSSFKAAKDFLKANNVSYVDNMQFNEIRNILMSRNPDMDQKVYTFMFRSSLFDHISTIAIIVCLLVSLQLLVSDYKFIKTDLIFKVFYCLLVMFIPLLGNSKRMFYSIAQRLPISNLK
ncbi:hypothetical protein [Flavobacterium sp. N502540]|uniref:hypothetical protein n=1 Tax=Flavobacterium sp. N502540 TaxID=2986838 RepID=UPI0022246F29|nr:hypothetical protein [Flavobacterium sp. N502540]